MTLARMMLGLRAGGMVMVSVAPAERDEDGRSGGSGGSGGGGGGGAEVNRGDEEEGGSRKGARDAADKAVFL